MPLLNSNRLSAGLPPTSLVMAHPAWLLNSGVLIELVSDLNLRVHTRLTRLNMRILDVSSGQSGLALMPDLSTQQELIGVIV